MEYGYKEMLMIYTPKPKDRYIKTTFELNRWVEHVAKADEKYIPRRILLIVPDG